MPPAAPISPMMAQDKVLGGDVRWQLAIDDRVHVLRLSLDQRLCGEHMLDLGRSCRRGYGASRVPVAECLQQVWIDHTMLRNKFYWRLNNPSKMCPKDMCKPAGVASLQRIHDSFVFLNRQRPMLGGQGCDEPAALASSTKNPRPERGLPDGTESTSHSFGGYSAASRRQCSNSSTSFASLTEVVGSDATPISRRHCSSFLSSCSRSRC